MQQSQNHDVLAVWSQLCADFRWRIPFLPCRSEIVPTLFNFGNDQVTWHRKHIRAWQRAAVILCPEEALVLFALRGVSRENAVILGDNLKSNTRITTTVLAVVLFAYSFAKALTSDKLSLPQFWSLLTQDPTVLCIVLTGLALMLLILLKNWIRMHQARELAACIELSLALRNAADGHRPTAATTSQL